ncbi:DNA (cytosine-5-)-methyltransferase [Fructilactobacillus sanfranciscensis]|uniref:DNA (cytosine-5-)-methyltransferase n=1 Tax=Fructilactobacillus sanfranciscensis TaxID=1625 RepID=UPI001EF0C1DE|nr:DNA (cytosine-5-)-methyltransferase [Fructilactobacillus sanfranciscensis]
MSKSINVLELFAGVGGFRVGLENSDKNYFNTKWANQFEPSRKSQDAFEVYNYHFPDSDNIGKDINEISDDKFKSMDADMIVGGFPCQDYSVARSTKNELGINGKKGVLFWQIIRAVQDIHPKYLLLENVDRLLKAPTKQRGRDFAIMLTALNKLNYSVEWRVINAAEYGQAQRRRRTYIFIFRNDLKYAQKLDEEFENDVLKSEDTYDKYLFKTGLFASEFPIQQKPYKNRKAFYELPSEIADASDNFSGKVFNTGVMRNGVYYTIDTKALGNEKPIPLKDVVQPEEEVPEKFFVNDEEKIAKFAYLRGPKKKERTSADGHTYTYSEGGMAPTDDLSLPGRTMLTSEGSVNRSTHWLKINDKYRFITPIEAERLQSFPDDWTKYKLVNGQKEEVTDRMRMFFMGNALVTNVIKRIGDRIKEIDQEEN